MGDYSNQHNGFSDDRSTSFLWNLSKEWEVRVGAYIFWPVFNHCPSNRPFICLASMGRVLLLGAKQNYGLSVSSL